MKRAIFIFSLSIVLSGIFSANLVFADDINKPKCKLKSETGEAIPSSFSVGECLTAEGQASFVSNLSENDSKLSSEKGIGGILIKAIDLLTKIIASVALIIFIIGALLTVTSEGKEDRLEKGKSAMLYAIIGLIVAFFSFIIVTFVQSVLF